MTSMPAVGFDRLKGVLLVLVVFGHTYSQGVGDDVSKWAIYGFHMPCFLFVSGYLANTTRLGSESASAFVARYWKRMLRQWAAVVVLWLFLYGNGWSPSKLLDAFVLDPPFHLWYVPVLFFCLALVFLDLHLRLERYGFYVLVAVGAVAYSWAQLAGWDFPFDARYVGYPLWFAFGLAHRAGSLRIASRLAVVLTAVGAGLWIAAYWLDEPWVLIGFMTLNVGAVQLVPRVAELLDDERRSGDALRLVGVHSLWIYLLHPLATRTIAWRVDNIALQRGVGVVLTAMIIVGSAQVVRARNAVDQSSRWARSS